MWYATQQPRQQFVLEEVIAYDAPLAGLGFLGRGGRYARAMQAIQPLKGVPRGRVIVPESPVAAARQVQPQQAFDSSYQPAALPVARQGKQFSDALWQDPRITAMMQPDPRTGWAQMSIGPGIGKEAYAARQREQKLRKYWQQTGL